METAGSVSKGCFAFKGKKKRAKIEDYLCRNTDGCAARRHEGFVRMWEEMDTHIQILQSDLNSKIFEDLLKFTRESHMGFTPGSSTNQQESREIPSAALVTGVNMPDHGVMFNNLVAMLREKVTPLVARLKSKDCGNVKSTLTTSLSQLLDSPDLMLDDEDEERTVKSARLPLTLSTLVTWYREKYMNARSSPKKSKSYDNQHAGSCPPIVVVFEDFECFLPRVVQDFISISSTYLTQLPLVFVFGIATSVSAVHRLLPNHVSSLLCMEKFQAPPSTEYLSLVINKVLMTPSFPFKLGSRVFQLLLDIFLYHDFSVLNFNKGLRFAMLDHYFNQSCSFLCCHGDDIQATVNSMNKAMVEKLRQLPSFMRYVENCPLKEQPNLLLNDNITKERIEELLNDVYGYHERLYPMLRCLHTLVSKLPSYPLGKQLREVYSLALERDVCETDSYTRAMDLLKMMSKDDLEPLVSQSLEPLSEGPAALTSLRTQLQGLLQRFQTLHEVVEEDDEDECQTSLPAKTSLHQLRQQLKDISKQKKKLSPYEKLRLEVMDCYNAAFREHIKCPKSLPLYEIFYYDSATSIKQHLNASPRSALQTALSNPHNYLQCPCCRCDDGHISATMPDLCIVYKLHLECGQLINLYDWMQAFVTVLQGDNEDTETASEPDKLLQARFIRAVSELQFLGFVKPTKRKTDHVARLTWGGC